jgi:hypothetical protein
MGAKRAHVNSDIHTFMNLPSDAFYNDVSV